MGTSFLGTVLGGVLFGTFSGFWHFSAYPPRADLLGVDSSAEGNKWFSTFHLLKLHLHHRGFWLCTRNFSYFVHSNHG